MCVGVPGSILLKKEESESGIKAVGAAKAFDVAAEGGGGSGDGMRVARNIWYVWTLARMNRQANGMTGRPSRRVRF